VTTYRWASIEAFEAWHVAIMSILNLPSIGQDGTRTERPDAARTMRYAEPTVVADDDVRVFVADNAAGLCPELLGQPTVDVIRSFDIDPER